MKYVVASGSLLLQVCAINETGKVKGNMIVETLFWYTTLTAYSVLNLFLIEIESDSD
jgi:hypothetical protein